MEGDKPIPAPRPEGGGIRTGRQAQAALLLAATGALRPIQERFK